MVEQVRQFLVGIEAVEFRDLIVKEEYYWVEKALILLTGLSETPSFRLSI